jgi:hypothetical protein
VTFGLVCTVGLGTAQAANLLATETAADIATFVPDANWDGAIYLHQQRRIGDWNRPVPCE